MVFIFNFLVRIMVFFIIFIVFVLVLWFLDLKGYFLCLLSVIELKLNLCLINNFCIVVIFLLF